MKEDSNIRYVRLITGEAVIAEVTYIGDHIVELVKPLQIYIDRQKGVSELVLAPWLPIVCSNESVVKIDRSNVLFDISVINKVSEYIANSAARLYKVEVEDVTDITEVFEKKPPNDVANALEQLAKFGKKKLS